MSSPLVELISISQQTERLLETRFGAQGRGLREKLDSVSDKIPLKIQKQIRFIAATRNLAAHNDLEEARGRLRAARQAFDSVRAALDPSAAAQGIGRRRPQRDAPQPSFLGRLWSRFLATLFPDDAEPLPAPSGSSFERLNEIAQETERLLTRRYKARGRGLHDKLTSVAKRIPENAQRKIRFIATIRNKAAHESLLVADENIEKVEEAFAAILPLLDRGASRRKVAFWLATAGALLAAFFVFRALR
ncbi:MAG: hypothetical protein IJO40_11615 [Thermoguttaceae bacterium]|nr:hypothetical protein [Thermoguttaceae bacterium]